MKNVNNFDEDKLKIKNKKLKKTLYVIIAVVIVAVIFVLTYCNFTDKFGIVPGNEKLSSGDKILYVLFNEGIPKDIEYNKEVSQLSLTFDQMIYDKKAEETITLSKGNLISVIYEFPKSENESNKVLADDIKNHIENDLNEQFSFETDTENSSVAWKYSTGAKCESIDCVTQDNSVVIVAEFIY